jgi:sec-independent protein translocase protein TatA
MFAGEGLLNLTMQIPMGMEWLLIVVVIVVVFFGVRKIPELARSFGKATSEFEKARIEAKKELQQLKSQESVGSEKLYSIAYSIAIQNTKNHDDELRAAIEVELNKGKQ